jgi:hypothetical protein
MTLVGQTSAAIASTGSGSSCSPILLIYATVSGSCLNPAVGGMSFQAASGYSPPGGVFVLAQFINTDSYSGSASSTGTQGLDNRFPYNITLGAWDTWNITYPITDELSMPLGTPDSVNVTRTFNVTAFLMWDPSSSPWPGSWPASIPVPLGHRSWGFIATAKCNSTPCTVSGGSTSWIETNGTPAPPNLGPAWIPSDPSQVSADSTTLVDGVPTWSGMASPPSL